MIVALTGHRPTRLNGHSKEVGNWIKKQLKGLEVDEALCGMAQGADQIFAKVAINNGIPLRCCYAFEKNSYHPTEKEIMNKASQIVFVDSAYSKKAYFNRDKYMVDECDVLLAVWDGQKSGGTWITIEYARRIGKEIRYIPAEILK